MLPVSRRWEAKLHFTNYETQVQKVCINCPHLHSCYLLKLTRQPRPLRPKGLHTLLNLWLEFLQDQVSARVLKAQVPTPPTPLLTSRKVNSTGPLTPSSPTKHTSPQRFANKNHLSALRN